MNRIGIATHLLLIGSTLFPHAAAAENAEHSTIVIDASTIQPVGTGLVPASTNDNFVLFVESGHRLSTVTSRPYTSGWMDPQGETRFARAGQPMPEMPFGCLLGTYDGTLAAGFYLPNQADWETQIAEVGDELALGLNMSDADLANLEGSVVVHVVMIPDGVAESGTFTINSNSTLPLPTGIVAAAGDEYIVLAKGLVRVPGAGSAPYSTSGFGPEGHSKLLAAGQIQASAPYGCLLGSYAAGRTMTGGFRIVNGGTWAAQGLDIGNELWLSINMSATDQSNAQGLFQVTVIRIPDPATAVESPADARPAGKLLGSMPNPVTHGATLAFSTAEGGPVVLRIYDAAGRWVRALLDEPRPAGAHEVFWDGRDDSGREVAAGTYYCQLGLRDHSETRKLVVVK